MILFVTGGRDFGDRAFAFRMFGSVRPRPELVVHGMCCNREGELVGADRWANEWACLNGIWVRGYPADWRKLDKAAGPIRNRIALEREKPDLVIALPGGHGTASAVSIALELGIPVHDTRTLPAATSGRPRDAGGGR